MMAISFPASPVNGQTHTENGQIFVFDSTRGYWLVKKQEQIVASTSRSTFVATAGQTVHNVSYDPAAAIIVSVNGVMLNPQDVTATNGTSITFDTALSLSDEVDIVFHQPTASNLTRHSVSDTAPSGASSGDLWFNSANLKTYVYYDDGSSAQWVATNPLGVDGADGADGADGTAGAAGADGSSVAVYANFAAFVNGNTEGDFAFAQDTKALYVWDGTEWDRISSGINESPIFSTEPDAEYTLDELGSDTTVTIAASDPEGFPVVYSHVTNPSNQTQATITNTGGTFTFTPSTNTAHAGSFTCRFRASDGTHVSTRTSTFELSFYNGYAAEYLTLTGGNLTPITYSGSGTDNLDAIIDARSQGDAILLTPGTYELNPINWDGYNSSNWRGKEIAIIGMTKDPADVVLNLNDAGAREKPIFSYGPSNQSTNYYNHFANMRVVRLGNPGAAADNYKAAIRREAGGGYVQNCIMDFNGNNVAWIYDNSSSGAPVGSFINCSFVNYASWLSNYNGNNHSALRNTNCAFVGTYAAGATFYGTTGTNISFGAGYTYTDNGSTYGHMKGILDTPTVSISAP